MRRRFDCLLQLFQSVLPKEYQAKLVRASRQLQAERQAYNFMPVMPGAAGPDVDLDMILRGRFVEVINASRRLAREAVSYASSSAFTIGIERVIYAHQTEIV